MFEMFSWVASIIAVIWARKHDIDNIISDESSRLQYASAIQYPEDRFRILLRRFRKVIESVMQRGWRMFFFCFMIAVIYSSFVFLMNLALANDGIDILNVGTGDIWKTRLLFVAITAASFLVYTIARYSSKHSPGLMRKASGNAAAWVVYRRNVKRRYYLYNIAGVSIYTISTAIMYRDVVYVLVALAVSSFACALSTPRLSYQTQFDCCKLGLIAGSGLGGHGLMTVFLFFAAAHDPFACQTATLVITAVCYVFSVFAVVSSNCVDGRISHRENIFWKALSTFSRPFLFVGFYCSRAPASFCIAVSAAAVIAFGMANSGLPKEVVVPASVIMTSAIFLAGATSLAGAGMFALVVMITLTIILGLINSSLLLKDWGHLILFWFIFPTVSATFDFGRWTLLIKSIDFMIARKRIFPVAFIIADIVVAGAAVVLFLALVIVLVLYYNSYSLNHGGDFNIPVVSIINSMHSNGENGIWFMLMIGTMLIPTIVNITLLVIVGIRRIIPQRLRSGMANTLRTASGLDALSKDGLVWRLAAMDSLMGIVFIVGAGFAIIRAALWVRPAVGEALYVLATSVACSVSQCGG